MFEVLVKFEGRCFTVSVDADWTVDRLKKELARCHGDVDVNPSDIEVIFCGKTLWDGLRLQDCEVQETSTLFATRRKSPGAQRQGTADTSTSRHRTEASYEGTADGYNSLEAHIVDLVPKADASIQDGDELAITEKFSDADKKPKIYIYCKAPCQSVQPGKLRVCCRMCKGGTFIVHWDPSCWDDVLIPSRIQGSCQTDGCSGSTAEFYFKCGSHPTTDDYRAVALYLIKCNTREVACLTCGDTCDTVLVFPCPVGHAICLDCFASYCRVRLDERAFVADEQLGYTLPCPVGCADSLIRETHHFRVLGDEQYSRYQQFGAEECLLQGGGVLCPSPGCGAGLVPDMGSRRVECVQQAGQGCGFVFCRECHNVYHEGGCDAASEVAQPAAGDDGGGAMASVIGERAAAAQWERAQSRETIRQTTKPCPKCKAPTEKSGGCMHMVCTVQQCKFEWCWVCSVEWNHQCMASHWFNVN